MQKKVKEVEASFTKQQSKQQQEEKKPFKDESVCSEIQLSVAASRAYICMNEAEMKGLLDIPRLNQEHTTGIPFLMLPAELDPSKQDSIHHH